MYTLILQSMKREMLRRRLSQRTIETYIWCIKRFFRYCKKEPMSVNKKDVKDYLDMLALKNASGSTLNVHLSAIMFYIEEVLHRRWDFDIKFSRRPKQLPAFLTKEEVKGLLDAIKNPKHRLMVALMYSAGLRVSEMLNLKINDLELDKNYGWVRNGKGGKDRLFIIAESLKEDIRKYIDSLHLDPSSFLFIGFKGWHMHPSSVREIIYRAKNAAKISKVVHPHTLRHSFATHIIENGYPVTDLQPLLGHNSIKTTMVYVHMANPRLLSVKSPLDSI